MTQETYPARYALLPIGPTPDIIGSVALSRGSALAEAGFEVTEYPDSDFWTREMNGTTVTITYFARQDEQISVQDPRIPGLAGKTITSFMAELTSSPTEQVDQPAKLLSDLVGHLFVVAEYNAQLINKS